MRDGYSKPIIGVVGGMGPSASGLFYEILINAWRRRHNIQLQQDYPRIVIDSVPVPDVVCGMVDDIELEIWPALGDSLTLLVQAGADIIAIPCNTIQQFLPKVAYLASPATLLNIVEETAEATSIKRYSRVGVLASTATVETGLYHRALLDRRITPITPSTSIQKELGLIIRRVIKGERLSKDRAFIIDAVKRMADEERIEAVIVGCTDLSDLLRKAPRLVSGLPIIDSLQVLARHTIFEYETLESFAEIPQRPK